MHFPAAAAVISTIKVRRKKNVFHAQKENFFTFSFPFEWDKGNR